jgi:hypothetical protein
MKRVFGNIAAGVKRLLFLLASLFLLAHMAACAFHFVALQPLYGASEAEGGLTWLATVTDFHAWTGLAVDSVTDPASHFYVAPSSRYIVAMYFVTYSLLSVGYGDVHAVNDGAA